MGTLGADDDSDFAVKFLQPFDDDAYFEESKPEEHDGFNRRDCRGFMPSQGLCRGDCYLKEYKPDCYESTYYHRMKNELENSMSHHAPLYSRMGPSKRTNASFTDAIIAAGNAIEKVTVSMEKGSPS